MINALTGVLFPPGAQVAPQATAMAQNPAPQAAPASASTQRPAMAANTPAGTLTGQSLSLLGAGSPYPQQYY